LDAFSQVFGPRRHLFDHARFTKELQNFLTASIGERSPTDEPPKYQAAVMEKKEDAFRLVSGRIQPMPGLMMPLALADRATIPMAAVTNAPHHRFKSIVIDDELPHGKPHPMWKAYAR
jgi:beta-phosphoglucomutase-like phosphatase (HAD superfamily)